MTLNVRLKTSNVVVDGIIDMFICSNVSSCVRAKKITAMIKMSSPTSSQMDFFVCAFQHSLYTSVIVKIIRRSIFYIAHTYKYISKKA